MCEQPAEESKKHSTPTLNYGTADYNTRWLDLGTGFGANHGCCGHIGQQNLTILVRPKLMQVNQDAHNYVATIAVKPRRQ